MSILDHEGMGTNEINPEVVIAAKSYYIQL